MSSRANYEDWIDAVQDAAIERGLDWHDTRHSDYPWYDAWDEFLLTPEDAIEDFIKWNSAEGGNRAA